MIVHTKRLVTAVCAVLIATVALLPPPVASAASSSLSIAPKKNYTIEPGKSINDKLTIRNLDTKQPLNLTLRVVDFTFTDDGGTPKLFLASDAPQETWSIKPFVTLPETVTVKPNGTTSVPISVAIPANHGAGSYYSAIVYSSGVPDGGNVGISASGVSLVFVNVPGTVKENLTLNKFGPYRQSSKDTAKAGYVYFNKDEPTMFGYTLKNDGNVVEAPVGSITLRNIFGKTYTINDVNTNKSIALIGQTRTFTTCMRQKAQEVDFNGTRADATSCAPMGLWPGYYSTSIDLFYGQNGNKTQEITKRGSFWYMPTWFIIVCIVALLLIAYFVWRIVLFFKKGKGTPLGGARRSKKMRMPRK